MYKKILTQKDKKIINALIAKNVYNSSIKHFKFYQLDYADEITIEWIKNDLYFKKYFTNDDRNLYDDGVLFYKAKILVDKLINQLKLDDFTSHR
jgi:hypothetical protein